MAWCLALVALAFAQSPGRVVADTKLDLAVDPGSFLLRATELWDPSGAFGQVQNQAYGYLFPMGPFFWLGSVVDLPPWVVQRLWWALVLVVAFTGAVKLLGVLGVGTGWTRILAGLLFALSPRMLTVLGPSSIEMWPSALAPWVLVPLVLATRRGDPRRWAALSALAVACVGGVNAVATFAVVPMAVWWIVAVAPRGPRRRSLVVWWPLLVALGTVWWVVPLLLLGSVSPPFLDYIESIANTSFAATTTDALRGTTNWVPYVDPASDAGRALVSDPVVILNGAVVVALGMVGLAMRTLPPAARRLLVPSLLVGLVLVTAGHLGATSGVAADQVRALLDGPLAPLRNTHKFDVLVRLPLVVGLCHALTVLAARATSGAEGRRPGVVPLGLAVLGIAAAVGATTPAWTGHVAPRGTFDEVPGYWRDAASWLETNAEGTTLLTPASTFGRYAWGRTNDEPLQPLLTTPWAVRNVVPLAPGGNIAALDTISRALAEGEGTAGLATFLRRAGIGTVVVRHDLDRGGLDVESPETVRAALLSTPGVRRVAEFGPRVGGGPSLVAEDGRRLFIDGGRQALRPAVEVFAVGGVVADRGTEAASEVGTVVGDSDSLLRLDEVGASGGASSVLAHDVEGDAPRRPLTLTDGNRRQEAVFGAVRRNRSASLAPDERYRVARGVHRYDEERLERWSTVPRLVGARSLTASSSAGDAGAPRLDPASAPWAAFDGDPGTAWRPNPRQERSAWLDLDLGRPVDVGTATITLDLPAGESRELRVGTQRGDVAVTVQGDRAVEVPVGRVEHLRLEGRRSEVRELAVREVVLSRHTVSRPLALPSPPAAWGAPDRVLLQALPGRNEGCTAVNGVQRCSEDFVERTEDGRRLDRVVPLPAAASYRPGLRVRAVAGPALDAVLQQDQLAAVSASSQSSASALGGPLAAVDGSPATGWVADPDDADPTITLRWLDEQRIDELVLSTPVSLAASAPRSVRLVLGDGTSVEAPVRNGRVRLDAVRTDVLEVHLLGGERRSTIDYSGAIRGLPLGLAEVAVPGAPGFVSLASEDVVTVPCDAGPTLSVGGVTGRHSVSARVADLASGRPVDATRCDGGTVRLAPGDNRVQVVGTDALAPHDLLLDAGSPAAGPSAAGRTVVRTGHNANPGWEGRVGDAEAEPLVLNGWQQGYLLPEGTVGRVDEVFAPGRTYRTALLLGAGWLLVLLLAALVPARPRWDDAADGAEVDASPGRGVLVVAVVAATLVAGVPAALAAAAGAGAVLLSRRRLASSAPALAGAVVAVAVGLYAVGPWGSFAAWAGDSVVPPLLSWLAVGAVVAGGVVSRPLRPFRRRNGRSTARWSTSDTT